MAVFRRHLLPLVALAMLPGGAVLAEGYKISASDLLRLRVLEWQPVDGTMRVWDAMTGEYRVNSDGTISVPFLGPVEAAGHTPSQLGTLIADGLMERLALPDMPDATVEIAEYRPVIVAGHVRNPGEVVYRPGITARQAIAMAGGPSDEIRSTPAIVRDLISQEGALRILLDSREGMLARRARLMAERANESELGAVPDLDSARGRALLAEEKSFMDLRRDQVERNLAAIDAQSELLTAEIEALQAKTVQLETQLELAEKEAANARNLSERGLVASGRLFETQRTLSAIESQRLDTSTAILRARQGITTAERDRIALLDGRSSEIAAQLQEVEAQILEIDRKIDTQRGLSVSLLGQAGGKDLAADPDAIAAMSSVIVMRIDDDELRQIPDAMDLRLEPGDMVQMTLRPPSTN
ncbi:polysaccharide biosynthesis/export family protein [Cereibacter azotoformans]|uniref:Exopolysaccharide production protein ExoF n=2 Tax=Cereibacter TaxID=1653176 RepID=A0A2T5KB30_9RHOB|nr:polysaccharide biosynthesis/export family protein [Cereibacter azotoformans]AXQ93883.1 glycosyl transferase [Cereibacter sphaeroides]MBO4168309.1 polysaccharide biosynthesis/export family protein [Cereibacter azotoformans]PTR19623.1 exopolysaccharide production protein ExoF [Cereibacter azotoformans]UIJ29400.1 polysaccharide biosynthesis/export family protein [Cereibacter azotoformans]ULB10111.1 polysaccharide biosynthesis/export family protein [Cereibacter azotoformans]